MKMMTIIFNPHVKKLKFFSFSHLEVLKDFFTGKKLIDRAGDLEGACSGYKMPGCNSLTAIDHVRVCGITIACDHVVSRLICPKDVKFLTQAHVNFTICQN